MNYYKGIGNKKIIVLKCKKIKIEEVNGMPIEYNELDNFFKERAINIKKIYL